MSSHAPLFDESSDCTADQLVTQLSKACEQLMQENDALLQKQQQLQSLLSESRQRETQTRHKIENLIHRLRVMEQEA